MAISAMTERKSTELNVLRKVATDLARTRNESLSTLHVLGAIINQSGPVAELLLERNITHERLFSSNVPLENAKPTIIDRIFAKATELSRRMGIAEASAAHLLMALLADHGSQAKRILENLGVDSTRLRSLAWNVGLGFATRRKPNTAQSSSIPSAPNLSPAKPERTNPPKKRSTPGMTIPLFPPNSEKLKSALGPGQPISIIPPPGQRHAKSEPPQAIPPAAKSEVVTNETARPDESSATISRSSQRRPKKTLERFELDPKRYPILTHFGRNLTLEAAENKLDQVVGRDREMDHTLDVLAKRHANSPCLVGPAGVGKTSIVRGLAQRIERRERTHLLDERILIELPVSELIAGTGVRGALAQRLSALRQEVKHAEGRVVVFFDEIHLLFTGDTADESSGEMKLALSRGEFPCIGATTAEDYRRSIENDPALARRFTAIDVEEPSREDAYLALTSTARKLESHHGLSYDEDALALTISWSIRYLPGRQLPDKAISIIDLAGARARRRNQLRVTVEHVADVVAEMASIPVERLLETDAERYLSLERVVAERVVGHESHIRKICSILRRNAAGLGDSRPMGTFLLLGPTGVGKTETAKALALALFNSETAMVRLDMAEYSESHAVARLIGSPPGYVGHDAGGQLTEAIRKRPYQVLLLDEIEKAHPDVLQSFLALFDEGRLTDGKGRTVDFSNTIVLLTSNLGAEHISTKQKRRVGFGVSDSTDHETQKHLDELVIAQARTKLSPELYNRLDEVLVYSALTRPEVLEIARRLLSRLGRSLVARETCFEVSDSALDFLVERGGFDAFLGARPMKRTIARLIEAPLADLLLAGKLGPGMTVRVDVGNDELTFNVAPSTPMN